jgi:hypothetical protein
MSESPAQEAQSVEEAQRIAERVVKRSAMGWGSIDGKSTVRLALGFRALQKAFQDELDNWNPEARPTITAERDALAQQLEQAQSVQQEWAAEAGQLHSKLEQDGLTIRDLQASEKHYHDLWKKAEQENKCWQARRDWPSVGGNRAIQAEQRIKELEGALEIAVSCVGNYAADSLLGEALAVVGINRHPEEDRG